MSDFASKASTFFNRALQKTEETLKTSDKTPYDPALEKALKDYEQRAKWAENLHRLVENVCSPNPTARLESKIRETIKQPQEKLNENEQLGQYLIDMAHALSNTSHGNALVDYGRAHIAMGALSKKFSGQITQTYLQWLTDFMHNEVKTCQATKSSLENARLDYGSAKAQLSRLKDQSKQLEYQQKMAEAEAIYRTKCDNARSIFQACVDKFDKHQEALSEMMKDFANYHRECANAASSS